MDALTAMKQAIEALNISHPYSNSDYDLNDHARAITALRAAIIEVTGLREKLAELDHEFGVEHRLYLAAKDDVKKLQNKIKQSGRYKLAPDAIRYRFIKEQHIKGYPCLHVRYPTNQPVGLDLDGAIDKLISENRG